MDEAKDILDYLIRCAELLPEGVKMQAVFNKELTDKHWAEFQSLINGGDMKKVAVDLIPWRD